MSSLVRDSAAATTTTTTNNIFVCMCSNENPCLVLKFAEAPVNN
jgi:hypothetical protein